MFRGFRSQFHLTQFIYKLIQNVAQRVFFKNQNLGGNECFRFFLFIPGYITMLSPDVSSEMSNNKAGKKLWCFFSSFVLLEAYKIFQSTQRKGILGEIGLWSEGYITEVLAVSVVSFNEQHKSWRKLCVVSVLVKKKSKWQKHFKGFRSISFLYKYIYLFFGGENPKQSLVLKESS